MNDLRPVSPVFLPETSSVPPTSFGYDIAADDVCVPSVPSITSVPRLRHRVIISYHNAPPSKILHADSGINLEVSFLETHDKLHIRHARFSPSDNHVADTYVFLPGKSVPIEGLQDQIERFVRRGHEVFTMDWRSQGLSSRTLRQTDKVHVNDFVDEYAADLRLFLDTIVHPQKRGRLFLVAYSMGAAVTAAALLNNILRRDEFRHIYLMAPLMEAKELTSLRGRMALPMARFAKKLGIGELYCLTTGDRNWQREERRSTDYTFDLRQFKRVAHSAHLEPRLTSGGPTYAWIVAYARNLTLLNRTPRRVVEVPCSIVLASHDQIVTNETTVRIARRLMANCEIHELTAAHALEMGGPETINRVSDIILKTSSPNAARPGNDSKSGHSRPFPISSPSAV